MIQTNRIPKRIQTQPVARPKIEQLKPRPKTSVASPGYTTPRWMLQVALAPLVLSGVIGMPAPATSGRPTTRIKRVNGPADLDKLLNKMFNSTPSQSKHWRFVVKPLAIAGAAILGFQIPLVLLAGTALGPALGGLVAGLLTLAITGGVVVRNLVSRSRALGTLDAAINSRPDDLQAAWNNLSSGMRAQIRAGLSPQRQDLLDGVVSSRLLNNGSGGGAGRADVDLAQDIVNNGVQDARYLNGESNPTDQQHVNALRQATVHLSRLEASGDRSSHDVINTAIERLNNTIIPHLQRALHLRIEVVVEEGSRKETRVFIIDLVPDGTHGGDLIPFGTLLADASRGAQAEIYQGNWIKLAEDNEEVVVKVLKPSTNGDDEMAAPTRMKAEAGLIRRRLKNHPNILQVLGFVEHHTEKKVPALITPRQPHSLEKTKGTIGNPEEAVRIAIEIAEGLRAIHDAENFHRDLKPANIFMEKDTDTALVADLGLIKILSDEELAQVASGGGELTQVPKQFGTPPYMSPEQGIAAVANSSKLTDLLKAVRLTYGRRTDIFALGVILFELLNKGASPKELPVVFNQYLASFQLDYKGLAGKSEAEINARIQAEVEKKNPGLIDRGEITDDKLYLIVNWLLAYDPFLRCPDAESAIAALSAWRAGSPIPDAAYIAAGQRPPGQAGKYDDLAVMFQQPADVAPARLAELVTNLVDGVGEQKLVVDPATIPAAQRSRAIAQLQALVAEHPELADKVDMAGIYLDA